MSSLLKKLEQLKAVVELNDDDEEKDVLVSKKRLLYCLSFLVLVLATQSGLRWGTIAGKERLNCE